MAAGASELRAGLSLGRVAPPNQRLKLAAPARNESGWRGGLRVHRHTFVNVRVRRRSLSAIR
jgi:hypothetical protein